MAALKMRYRIETDARTDEMSAQALQCRSMNHPWQRIPLSPSRRRQLLTLGQTESTWICMRCTAERTDLFELPTFDTLVSKIRYPEGYLMAKEFKGTGKLPRREARKALFVRDTNLA